MSSGVDVPSHHRRPGLWSYLSNFGQSSHSQSSEQNSITRNRRTSSVSLPTRNVDNISDPLRRYHSGRSSIPGGPYGSGSSGGRAKLFQRSRLAWMNYGQRTRYLKASALLACILFIFFFLAPSEREKVGKYVEDHAPFRHEGPSPQFPSNPDLRTDKCNKPYSANKPIVQYVLMIDAGSTGSRIHVYRFNNCGSTPELENEVFHQTPKREQGSGLSSYAEDIEGAARSLDVLMDVAMKNVPASVRTCTPIAVKATAGLRKLGSELSDKILAAVRTRLETQYPFPVLSHDKGGVEVMDGKYEGVYAWITTNYLLGKIGGPDDSPTAAVFDLGGGSTQIVFEPNFKTHGGGMPKKLEDGDHKYELDFGGRQFSLYQHSYLGYGLMAARKNIHSVVAHALIKEMGTEDVSWLNREIVNPCIVPGMEREVEVDLEADHPLGKSVKLKMIGPHADASLQCLTLAEKTLRKDAECKLHPCAFDGVHQPSLERTLATEDVYLFSYFYDRIKPLGMPESFTLRELKGLVHTVCGGEQAWEAFHSIEGALDELRGRPESCLDLSFMFALLHLGYEMPLEREVRIAKKIRGNELGWCLGASLPLLAPESGWTCKIAEVL